MKILVINGPNINFLGIREPGIYGNNDYESLKKMLYDKAHALKVDIDIFQSNHEGEIIDRIQQAYNEGVDGIIINPGGLTHTSVSLHDALASIAPIPIIEVHISNIASREAFRHVSLTAPACKGQIAGLGLKGYIYALEDLASAVG